MPRQQFWGTTISLALACGNVAVETPATRPTTQPSTQPAAQPARAIQSHDLLWVMIRDLLAPGKSVELLLRVDPEGRISLPCVGQVDVGGATVRGASECINNAYGAMVLPTAPSSLVELAEPAERAAVNSGPISVGDTVLIRIWNLESPGMETRLELEIRADGTAILPRVGAIQLAGRTDFSAERQILEIYHRRLNLPQTMVSVLRVGDGDR